jgi:hypothetical protein
MIPVESNMFKPYRYGCLKVTTGSTKLNNHTNIILASVPNRHDLHGHTYVNNEMRKYNINLFKIIHRHSRQNS